MVVFNNKLLFKGTDDVGNIGLWQSDGSVAGTMLLKAIDPQLIYSIPGFVHVQNNHLYFLADDGIHGRELWRTDGTPAGTTLVKNVNTYPRLISAMNTSATLDDKFFFDVATTAEGNELWRTTGSQTTTSLVKDINPGSASANPQDLTEFANHLFFSADDGTHGRELWISDGTMSGTNLLMDISPGQNGSAPDNLIAIGNNLFFTTNSPQALWRSDGTAAGTQQLAQGNFSDLVEMKGHLYAIRTVSRQRQLWQSDGSSAGTIQIADIGIDNDIDNDSRNGDKNMISTPNRLYFLMSTRAEGVELATSDGTADGTSLIKDINPGNKNSLNAFWQLRAATMEDVIYFAADDGSNEYELWRSDGTAGGTMLVKDLNPGPNSSTPDDFVVWHNQIYFMAYVPGTGMELWKSDGNAGGTTLVKDFHSGPHHGFGLYFYQGIFATEQALYLRVDDGIHGFELWRSDGTVEGTALVSDINPGQAYSLPLRFAQSGERLYFNANSFATGSGIWSVFLGQLDHQTLLPLIHHNAGDQ